MKKGVSSQSQSLAVLSCLHYPPLFFYMHRLNPLHGMFIPFFLHFPMATLHLVCSLSLLLLISSTTNASRSGEVVREVCNQTTYYSYCVDALYSDPRTPNADRYFLSYISFGLVFANASNTLDYISNLLKSTPKDPNLTRGLQVCQGWYRRGVNAMLSANSDLDSRSYTKLASYAGLAVRGADMCKDAIDATHSSQALGLNVRSRDVKRLSYICGIVSRLLP